MDEKKAFGGYIRQKRVALELTQRELAQRLYVAESTVSKWERGLSYPDVSLIPAVCRALDISEHEFFTACDDESARTQALNAKRWRGLTKGLQFFFAACYTVALAVCLICDLAIFHRLDWFWIVLASLALAFCFTNLPGLVHKDRAVKCLGAASAALLLLILACWGYTGGTWVLAGMGITAVCLVLPWALWALRRFYGRHLDTLGLAVFSIWVFLLLGVIGLFTGGDWLWRLGCPIAGFSLAALWVFFATGRCLPVGRLWKTGIHVLLTALLLPAATAFADKLTGGMADPKPEVYFQWGRLLTREGYAWINTLIFIVLLTAAAVLLILGTIRSVKAGTARQAGEPSP